ncbi:unnamed protein product [marine sediment metagenome]|uniref:Uncharacterized protein n=1 Tax=marine sediment metagenome TaxID=412755 RepID=X1E357_9ZZZZ
MPIDKAPTLAQCDRSLRALQMLFKDYPRKLPPAVVGMAG